MPAELAQAAVVWLAPPGEEASKSLASWAAERGVALVVPEDTRAPGKPVDWGAGDEAERAIAKARDALVGLDFATADAALDGAEQILRDHPELPQAAWLMAEAERVRSARWLRATPPDLDRARKAWQSAAALDGGRVAGLGERAFEAPASPAGVTVTIALDGFDDGDVLEVDGEPASPGPTSRAEGPHAVVVRRADGAVAWASWEPWTAGAVVRATAPAAPPCSTKDLGRARLVADAPHGDGVSCPRWVAALGDEDGAVRVASCEGSSCGAFVTWKPPAPTPLAFTPVTPIERPHPWPAWATWTVAGVWVAGAAVAVVVASGALRSAPTETQFVNGGIKVH